MNIAFVLLTYGIDEPAGIEYSVDALAEGCRRLGHEAFILTSATSQGRRSDLVRLSTVHLPRPATEEDLMKELKDPAPVCREVERILTDLRVDAVCWADASWGLGYLAPAPPGISTVLRFGVLRTDPLMQRALGHGPDAVFTCSPYLTRSATDAGLDTTAWRSIPDPLRRTPDPVPPDRREHLRKSAPVRIAVRAEPHKGIEEFIDACPSNWSRPVEIALAAAAFEYWPGMQQEVIDECRRRAETSRTVRILPALPWDRVGDFFAGAAVTVNCSTAPETFGIAAAQSLAVGTPVVHYALGHLPSLVGEGGPSIDPAAGPHRIWEEIDALLADAERYHRAAGRAPLRIADLTPEECAARFLSLIS
ncbi:glycosyltransferase [Nocardiopsis chromatogenes]|uniref:glycosyltransferase n=1 Tax=Nocardiopsis chromatogenes TaxID=280239 RepID=UPI000381DEB5|nr:glycosyltransferase [Nocardiopsis chromatogenes]